MSKPPSYHNPEFDQFAEDYDEALEKGIAVSGEHKEYFAQGRVKWLDRRLSCLNFTPARILDFGCGTGTGTPFLLGLEGSQHLIGVEVSEKSLTVAQRLHGSERAHFQTCAAYQPAAQIDLAFCNGVFHHIPLAERPGAVRYLFESLRPGGHFALWENNPWNPGTRYIMSRIPFDRDAITLSAPESRALLRSGGFEIVATDFLFIFPKFLSWLRPLEGVLSKLPLGAQYLILARRPAKLDAASLQGAQ
jgi:SAM-dependent methyltransferase